MSVTRMNGVMWSNCGMVSLPLERRMLTHDQLWGQGAGYSAACCVGLLLFADALAGAFVGALARFA
jgi:hypothetical protein